MKILLIAIATMFGLMANAYVKPLYSDVKPASQAMLEKQDFATPIGSSVSRLKLNYAGATSAAAVTLSSFTAQPDVPRNIVITPGGTTADIASCTIVVSGLNILGKSMSENFVFGAGATTATTGSKAFKSVSSVVWPANCETGTFGGTWSIGVGTKLGIKRCMAAAGDWAWSQVDGVYSGTRATIAVNGTLVESNTATFNESLTGSADPVGYFVQNFQCLP